MNHDCWTPTPDRGFLMNPDPINDFGKCDSPLDSETAQHLQDLAVSLPALIADRSLRSTLEDLSVFDMTEFNECEDGRVVERAFQIYAHLANAYVWCDQDNPAESLPTGIPVDCVI